MSVLVDLLERRHSKLEEKKSRRSANDLNEDESHAMSVRFAQEQRDREHKAANIDDRLGEANM